MIKFCDLNHNLVTKVRDLGIESVQNDYFNESVNTPRAVLMTASNPHFSMGGGLDAKFLEYFPYYCKVKQIKGGGNERIGNIIFAVTVGSDFKATKELVKEAIQFAIDNTDEGETLLLSGVGTGIGANGNFTEDDFVEVLKSLLAKD
jgi:hypothetical protein